MRLIDKEHCYIIAGVFPSAVIAGFTKPDLGGNLPQDAKSALSFLGNDFKVSYLNQLHGNKVNFIEEEGVYDGDGLICAKKNLALVIRTADCLPVLFYDRRKKMIGALHMGWRSAETGILDNIEADIIFAGAGLRQCCYRVGDDFLDYPNFSGFIKRRDSRLYFDPIKFVKETVNKNQLKPRGFFDLNICSFCSSDKMFSYRKTKCAVRTLSFIMKLW